MFYTYVLQSEKDEEFYVGVDRQDIWPLFLK
jgi:hypothetical protein